MRNKQWTKIPTKNRTKKKTVQTNKTNKKEKKPAKEMSISYYKSKLLLASVTSWLHNLIH